VVLKRLLSSFLAVEAVLWNMNLTVAAGIRANTVCPYSCSHCYIHIPKNC